MLRDGKTLFGGGPRRLEVDERCLANDGRHIEAHRHYIAGSGIEVLLHFCTVQRFVVNGNESLREGQSVIIKQIIE